MTSRRVANSYIWEEMMKDIEIYIDNKEITIEELGLLLDCYYRIGVVNPPH